MVLLIPELDAAEDARVGIDLYRLWTKINRESFRVASTDVDLVEVQQCVHCLDRLGDSFIPLPVANLLSRFITNLLVVGLTVAERVMGEFEPGPQASVLEDRSAESGAERYDELKAIPGHNIETLHIGIVDDPRWLAEGFGERCTEVERLPEGLQLRVDFRARTICRDEVRRGEEHVVAHHTRECHRDAVVLRHWLDKLNQHRNQFGWIDWIGRLYPRSFSEHFASRVKYRSLETGTANVDGQGVWFRDDP